MSLSKYIDSYPIPQIMCLVQPRIPFDEAVKAPRRLRTCGEILGIDFF